MNDVYPDWVVCVSWKNIARLVNAMQVREAKLAVWIFAYNAQTALLLSGSGNCWMRRVSQSHSLQSSLSLCAASGSIRWTDLLTIVSLLLSRCTSNQMLMSNLTMSEFSTSVVDYFCNKKAENFPRWKCKFRSAKQTPTSVNRSNIHASAYLWPFAGSNRSSSQSSRLQFNEAFDIQNKLWNSLRLLVLKIISNLNLSTLFSLTSRRQSQQCLQ